MNAEKLDEIMTEQFEICRMVMGNKAREYTDENEDKLAAIKAAAALQGISPQAAAMGMMSKHIVSIADMCTSGEEYTDARWNEKITDAMNYLFFIRAIVQEQSDLKDAAMVRQANEAMLP